MNDFLDALPYVVGGLVFAGIVTASIIVASVTGCILA